MFLLRHAFKIILIFFSFWLMGANCQALDPDEVLIVANQTDSASIELARYYSTKRKIPPENIFLVNVTHQEVCSFEEYFSKLAIPIRKQIHQMSLHHQIKCIVLMYGIPLKIKAPEQSKQEAERLKVLMSQRKSLARQVKQADKKSKQAMQLKEQLQHLNNYIHKFNAVRDRRASVESELSLLMIDSYPTYAWIENPYYVGMLPKYGMQIEKSKVMMVGRLDAPEAKMVKKMIDDAIKAEIEGISGKGYFDARWPIKISSQMDSEYKRYDYSIQKAADWIEKNSKMDVIIDNKQSLFQKGECPDTGLYCGWYSLAKYIEAFSFNPGSIGYHIASSECNTLKNPKSRVWCKMMIENGITATLGPVNEPYLSAFPLPEKFFPLLLDGKRCLIETYYMSLPYLSWKMALIGDPLYRPMIK